jgi:HEAT repeat protein
LPGLVRRLVSAAADDDFEIEEELRALSDALVAMASPGAGDDALTGRAIELLTTCLDTSSEDVRLAVSGVLGGIGRPQDADIIGFLLRDPSSRVRRSAVEALARLEPGTAAEPLRLALADESAAVRIAAAHALGRSESDEIATDLARLATDEDPRVRGAAARSVVARFARAPVPDSEETAQRVLEAALCDEPSVVLAVLEALREHGGPDAGRACEMLSRPEPEIVREAVRCIAAHAELAGVEAVMPLVSHPDWSVRAEAIQALADRGLAKGVPAILRRLETESDDFVRGVTLRALKRLESEMG